MSRIMFGTLAFALATVGPALSAEPVKIGFITKFPVPFFATMENAAKDYAKANPEVEIQVGTEKLKAKARTATGAERAKLWKEGVVFWPPYADYQVKAGSREIPVVVLDPVN